MPILCYAPHTVTVRDAFGDVVFEPMGVARAVQKDVVLRREEIDGLQIATVIREFGELTGLPDPVDGTLYIVSLIAAQAALAARPSRNDILITDGPIRDDADRIVACERLIRPVF